jgi:hypothetical protein
LPYYTRRDGALARHHIAAGKIPGFGHVRTDDHGAVDCNSSPGLEERHCRLLPKREHDGVGGQRFELTCRLCSACASSSIR